MVDTDLHDCKVTQIVQCTEVLRNCLASFHYFCLSEDTGHQTPKFRKQL